MEQQTHKVVIVGGGPAAWSAALYLARARMNPLVLAGDKVGGQLMLTTVIENYPGFVDGIDGSQLVLQMKAQAESFGTLVKESVVSAINSAARPFSIETSDGTIFAEAIVIATGAEAMWLSVPGEREHIGRGVSACAVCDAAFYRGKKTFVIGGGDAAMEDALALTRFAGSVTLVHRRDSFKASKVMVDRVLANEKVSVLWNTVVEEIIGDPLVSQIRLKNMVTNEVTTVSAEGVFVAIGHKPATAFLQGGVALDPRGYVMTSFSVSDASASTVTAKKDEFGQVLYPTSTSVEGIFAGGDCVDFRYRQASTAAGWGVMAALDAERFLEAK
jgi:thioredoxin reductase (NADPH)